MRIALVSTLVTAVSSRAGASVELIVGLMAEALRRRGHEVTVFASGDSCVSTGVRSILSTGYLSDPSIWDWQLAEFMQLGHAYESAAEFDVINSHVYCYALPFTRLVRTPTVHTFHICPTPDFVRFCRMYPEGTYVMLTEFQRSLFGNLPVAAVIPNGIDTGSFAFNPTPGSYLVYLGSLRPHKGPLEAIHCARAAGVPIRLAGAETEYFHDVIKPEVDGRSVEYVGQVGHEAKVSLLAGALALIFVPKGPEAFGLVMLESMACGTPVLAIGSGPVPEIVRQGVSGIYTDHMASLVRAVSHIGGLDRTAVRQFAVEHFDVSRMVDDYLRLFDRLTLT